MNKKCAELLNRLESQGRIKVWKDFSFPEPFDNGVRFRDVLESKVDESFYIDDAKCAKLLEQFEKPQEHSGIYTNQSKNFQRRPYPGLSRALKASMHDAAVVIPLITNVSGRIQDGVAGTLETQCNQAVVVGQCRIRRLTPKECFRLMGFSDGDYDKLKSAGISNSQLYKIAGNSIVVNVLMEIFKGLLCPKLPQFDTEEELHGFNH